MAGLTGVVPVLEVPFREDESVDLAGFESVIARTERAGADALMFPAFASEFLKLSPGERAELEELLVARATVPVILAVQEHSTKLAGLATRRAALLGASGVNVLPPHRLGVSGAAMRRHLEVVLESAGETPVIVQYAPAETGMSLGFGLIGDLAARFGNLWGVKVDSSPAGAAIAAVTALSASAGREVHSAVGYAGLHLIDGFDRGAVAVQPGCSFTELYVTLWGMLSSGQVDEAAAFHRRMLPWLAHWMQGVELIVAVEKEISRRRGWFGSARVREPGYTLDRLEHERIDRFLAEFSSELG